MSTLFLKQSNNKTTDMLFSAAIKHLFFLSFSLSLRRKKLVNKTTKHFASETAIEKKCQNKATLYKLRRLLWLLCPNFLRVGELYENALQNTFGGN